MKISEFTKLSFGAGLPTPPPDATEGLPGSSFVSTPKLGITGIISVILALLLIDARPALAAGVPPAAMPGVLLLGQKTPLDEMGEEEEPLPKKPAKSAPSKPPPAEEEEPPEKEEPSPPKEKEKPSAKEEEPKEEPSEEEPPPKPEMPEEEEPLDEEPPEKPKAKAPPREEEPLDEEGSAEAEASDKVPEEKQFYDVVWWTGDKQPGPRRFPAMPFREHLGDGPPYPLLGSKPKLQRYTSAGKGFQFFTQAQIRGVEYYEERMVELAATTAAVPREDLVATAIVSPLPKDLAESRAVRAEEILSAAIAEHDSAIQRGVRWGPEWNEHFRRPLVQARLNLRLTRIDRLIREEKYQQAEVACDRISEELAADSPQSQIDALRHRVEAVFLVRTQGSLAQGDFAAVRKLLDQLEIRYPGKLGAAAARVRDELVGRAEKLRKQAESLKKTSPREAAALIEQASAIWPTLDGIEGLRRQIKEGYPVLRCAYGELPTTFSPILARTPADRHAVALIFEGLVRWVDDPKSGAHYESDLALGAPIPLAKGRGFRLPPCKWSDSSDAAANPCFVQDVRATLNILRDERCPGFSPAWSRMLKVVDNPEDGNPFSALVRLERDYWQPLSLMDFKILPSHCFKPGEDLSQQLQEFAEDPVGTGPYRLSSESDPSSVVRFVANPYYRVPGLPKIREIVFTRFDAVKMVPALTNGDVDLVFGVSREHVNQLRKVISLRAPTVSFLAPNYRRESLRNVNVRLAIAHAIDRQAILTSCFRPGGRAQDHAELTGPYPKDSWAYNLKVPPFEPAKARAFADLAREQLSGAQLRFTLSYPAYNPDVEAACKKIADDVRAVGIELEPKAVEPEKFYTTVIPFQNFDLAYWSHTYEDSTYWLEPLLDADPRARNPGGPNFMSYVPDKDMARFFEDFKRHKCFRDVQMAAHNIHDHVARSAIFIPLWQLDTYLAVNDRVQYVRLDPLVLFEQIEQWTLRTE